MVGPLRAERIDDTPEEPTPIEQQKNKLDHLAMSVVSSAEISEKSNGASIVNITPKGPNPEVCLFVIFFIQLLVLKHPYVDMRLLGVDQNVFYENV